ncbi:MAG TPA: efflux RND transporter periplasmic adaptor subunit [Cytophaga sp.]|jgi:cobalt-zinc-cadmium efflux system membrane fusion protein|nr:efflux RND transporter periplasmic adaptor subunit [Cytophaga sp.]
MKYFVLIALVSSTGFFSCKNKQDTEQKTETSFSTVLDGGKKIKFTYEKSADAFLTEDVQRSNIVAALTFPAKVAATVIQSDQEGSSNIILFEDPDLAGNYTALIQHNININQIKNVNIVQKRIELERVKDLKAHGVSTGKDLLEAETNLSMEETNLANERAALLESESNLNGGGFQPDVLRKSKAGTAYIICEVPESQMSKIKKGDNCFVEFTSMPGNKFKARIDGIADIIDNVTRMIKVRINIDNSESTLKLGMYGMVLFEVNEGNNISVSNSALITVQGKNYVFLKRSPVLYERKEVFVGPQIDNRVIIYDGLNVGDQVVTKGIIQLKGLSFGY